MMNILVTGGAGYIGSVVDRIRVTSQQELGSILKQGVEMDLKERAIYELPNGRELVALVSCENKAVLYPLGASDAGQYETNSEGRLIFDGKLTAWDVGDLFETGRMASPDHTATLAAISLSKRDNTHEQNA